MNYEEFTEEFQTQLQDDLIEEGANIQRMFNNAKVNGPQDSLVINFEGMNTAPVVYLQDAYIDFCNGIPIEELTMQMSESLKAFYYNPPSIPKFDKNFAEQNIYSALINLENNQELLSRIPYEPIEDLAIIARMEIGEGSAIVTNDMCKDLKLTSEEVLEIASKNTETRGFVCDDLSTVMCRMMGDSEDIIPAEEKGLMFMMSNPSGIDGAVAITSKKAMNDAMEKIGEPFYVLPASRHEVILLAESKVDDVNILKDMVKGINATELQPKDVLSNSVYFFNGKKLSIAVDKTKEKAKEITQVMKQAIRR